MGYDFAKTVGVPEKSNDFLGRGGATEGVNFSCLHGNERYEVCDDKSEATPLKRGQERHQIERRLHIRLFCRWIKF